MPAHLGVLLSQIDVGKGREELYRDQLPALLRSLADQTRVESIRASNAIEGVNVPRQRAERLAAPEPPRSRNRSEEEFAGYRDAIDGLMREESLDPPTPALLLRLHRQLYAHTKTPGGRLKQEDNVIGERDGQHVRRVIFRPPPWRQAEGLVQGLFGGYLQSIEAETAHPLLALAAFILDLLAIHPFGDGNGRVARLLTTYELLRLDYGVARYVSVEQRIFETRNDYYDALERSQRGWHDGEHEIWPWTAYLIGVLASSYADFENRVAAERETSAMSKTERVRHWVMTAAPPEFSLSDVRRAVPGVSDPTIRLALRSLRDQGELKSKSSGRAAVWQRTAG
ncbi:MAG TPA: Fic family protein [Solirubrobacterales bacterium]|nr:Fic family protein [Solirubrobacterales bacterium]